MSYFDYSEEFDIEELLEDSQQREEQRLEKELEQIEQQLEERNQIFDENREELKSKLEWYIERIGEEYGPWGNGPVDELKQKIEQIYTFLREERVQNWRDRQELEKERRRIIREIEELGSEPSLEEFL